MSNNSLGKDMTENECTRLNFDVTSVLVHGAAIDLVALRAPESNTGALRHTLKQQRAGKQQRHSLAVALQQGRLGRGAQLVHLPAHTSETATQHSTAFESRDSHETMPT